MSECPDCDKLADCPCDDARLRVALDELLPMRDAARKLPDALARLEAGEVQHLVVTRRNAPRAVLVTVERYEQLLREGQ